MAATDRLNLRRKPRTWALFGTLVSLLAGLMLAAADRSLEQSIFGLLFLVGGIAAVAYVDRLTVEASSRELVHQRGLIVPLHSKRYALDRIRAVNVRKKIVRKGRRRQRTSFPIHLQGIKGAVVLDHGNPWFSRVIAERLASLLGVPLINRVYGTSTTRQPGDLDTPLIERWIQAEVRFDMPARPTGSDLRETVGGSSYELSMSAEFPSLKYAVVLMLLASLPAVLEIPPTDVFHSTPYRFIAVFLSVSAVLMSALVGRSKLRISAEEVSFRQGWFPVRRKLAIRDIEELIVAGDGITLVGDAGAVWLHWGRNKRESAYLEAVVPYQILRLGRYASSGAATG